MPEVVVHCGDNPEPNAQNSGGPHDAAAANEEIECFKIHCPNCGAGIEFPAHGVGDEIECPHCKRVIILTFPLTDQGGPTEQIDTYLRTSAFPKTHAELQFLKVFALPRELGEVSRLRLSQEALGAPSEVIISRLFANAFLQDGGMDIAGLLELKSKNELKSLAKVRGLSQSGTKEDLAKKLFEADPGGISGLFHGKTYLTCTRKGKLLVDKFEQAEKEVRLKAEGQSESALRASRYQDACTIVANFEASQIFPRGVGINWKRYDAAHDIEILSEIAAYSPRQHHNTPESVLASLRVSAGMMNLWGESDPSKWLTGSEREFARETYTMLSAAINRVNLRDWKRLGFREVRLLSSGRGDACKTCKEADKQVYPIDSAPELPHVECICEYGCGCIFVVS